MIPAETQRILGSSEPKREFHPDSFYAVTGVDFADLEALVRRLGTEQRMHADEMRDWMNRLHLMVSTAECMDE